MVRRVEELIKKAKELLEKDDCKENAGVAISYTILALVELLDEKL